MARDDAKKTTNKGSRAKKPAEGDATSAADTPKQGARTRSTSPRTATSRAAGTSSAKSQNQARNKEDAPSQPKTRKAPSKAGAPTERDFREPTHDEIAQRAYRYWRESGGGAYENWTRAERDLKREK